MKKLTTILLFCVAVMSAQTQYEKGMTKAFELWKTNKLTEAVSLFERISKAEKDNWLPSYYVASVEVYSSFGLKDEAKLNAKLKKAQEYLDVAKSISENNPEIIVLQATLNTAYIAFDGQKYGMTLSIKNTQLYEKALELAPKNPRVIMSKAEWDMGSARFFKQSTEPYCKDIERAIKLSKEEKITEAFYPRFSVERATQVLEQCKKGAK